MSSDPHTKAMPETGGLSLARSKKDFSAKSLETSLDPWVLLGGFRRRWLQASITGMLFAVLVGGAIWFLSPSGKHYVRSLLHVMPRDPYVLFPKNDARDPYSFELYRQTQMALASSRYVVNAALKQDQPERVADLPIIKELIAQGVDPVQWLESEVRADFSTPETMRISMQGDRAKEMIVLVNAVTKAYLIEFADKEKNYRQKRIDGLRKVHARFNENIQAKRNVLRDVAKAAGTTSAQLLAVQQQIALQQLGMAKSELADIKLQERRLQNKMDVQVAFEKGGEDLALGLYCYPPTAHPATASVSLAIAGALRRAHAPDAQVEALLKERFEELIQSDPEFRKYLDRETELIDLIPALRRVIPPDGAKGPAHARETELENVRKTLKAKRDEVRPKYLAKLLRESNGMALSSSAKLRMEMGYLHQLEKVVAKDVEQLIKENQLLNESSLDLEEVRDYLERWQGYYGRATAELDTFEVEESAPSRITLLEEAVVYDGGPKRLRMMQLGGFGTFALICFAFSWWEVRARRVNSPTQLVQTTGMPLIGTLPDYSKVAQSQKKSVDAYESILSDSVDAVRTLLLFISKMEGIRAVLVTSAVTGEGKTFSACHLAASLARTGRKTLLLDCDIRNPAVHKVFDIELVPGLSEVLRVECELPSAVRPSNVENLFILPAGQGCNLALRVLALQKTGEVFKELREQFDFIIVDSSPVLPVPDALLVAQHTDAALFAILRDVSQFPRVHAAYQRLGNLGVRILGAVFNGNKDELSSMYNYAFPTANKSSSDSM
jgi:succinoglycan biosynthesis transport protein ExoP